MPTTRKEHMDTPQAQLKSVPRKLLPHQINELRPELLGIHAMNPAVMHNSPSRSTMTSSHISQHLVFAEMDIPDTITGTEVEYSKYTFASRVKEDSRVVQVIQRYPGKKESSSLNFNPETIVILEDVNTGQFDYVSIPYHTSLHQYFGFRNQNTDAASQLSPGTFVAKDTVLSDTPANIGDFYTCTTNLNVALISEAGVAEDGVVICEDVLDKFKFNVYEVRTISLGSRKFPINIGGSTYKSFPDIGEYTDNTGALLYLREYGEGLSPVLMSKSAVSKIDFNFDEGLYARQSRGRVVDIKVIGNTEATRNLPPEMGVQFEKYRTALVRYYEDLLRTEARLMAEAKRRTGDPRINLSRQLSNLLVTARAMTNHNRAKYRKGLQLLLNKNPVDEYQITFTVEYSVTPDIGFKITGLNGDKGVITSKLPRHRMPVDKDGNSADLVMAPDATVARTNYARQYMMYAAGAARDAATKLRSMCGLTKECSLEDVELMDDKVFSDAWHFLMEYYECINPPFRDLVESKLSEAKRRLHMYECLSYKIVNVRNVDCPKPWPHVVMDLEAKFPQTYDVVRHGMIEDGKYEVTKDPVRIAPMAIMLLDKTADDTLSVATGAHGIFGVLVKPNQSDKHSKPYKESPPRTLGEAELRAMASHSKSPELPADLVDRANNPAAQLEMARQIVNSETPGNIADIIDREKFPYGNTKPLQLAENFYQAYGVQTVYVEEDMDPLYKPASLVRK